MKTKASALVAAFLILATGALLAQKPLLSMIGYGYFPLFDQETFLGFDPPSEEIIGFDGVGLAISMKMASGRYHEFECSRFRAVRASDNGGVPQTVTMSGRYEYGVAKNPGGLSRFQFRFGGAIRPYLCNLSDPLGEDSFGYPMEQSTIGAILSFNTHVEVRVFRQLFLDFSPHLDLFNFSVRTEQVYNPDYDEQQSESIDFFSSAFHPVLRTGLGWRF